MRYRVPFILAWGYEAFEACAGNEPKCCVGSVLGVFGLEHRRAFSGFGLWASGSKAMCWPLRGECPGDFSEA